MCIPGNQKIKTDRRIDERPGLEFSGMDVTRQKSKKRQAHDELAAKIQGLHK